MIHLLPLSRVNDLIIFIRQILRSLPVMIVATTTDFDETGSDFGQIMSQSVSRNGSRATILMIVVIKMGRNDRLFQQQIPAWRVPKASTGSPIQDAAL